MSKVRTRQVLDALERALQYVYNTHIYPDPRGADKEFGMILGLSTPEANPILLKTAGTGVLISDSYEYVYLGSGSEMAMYLSSRFDVRGMPISVGELMAAFILWEVKQPVQTCGGESVIYKLTNNDHGGKCQYRGEGDIRDFEDYCSKIDRKIQRIRIRFSEPGAIRPRI